MPLKIGITKDVLYKRGMEIAIEKGVKEEKEKLQRKLHDIALQLKKKGFSAEEVAEITGLSVSAIAKP